MSRRHQRQFSASKGTLTWRWLAVVLLPAVIGAVAAIVALDVPIVGVWVVAASVSTFLVYAWDKLAAKTRRGRVPERALLAASALGGAPGGLLAMQFVRHKTRHAWFWLVNMAFTAAWICAAVVAR
ncbi:hypothetical protein AYO38_03100 [bacterium SCGC AG-212-C10]|nr:hypothetical protein AYO38_03100 [bacterium SCGC AG-212-C10]